MKVTVAGAGPAGSCAAIAAALGGAQVTLCDRSRFPRHKVCGEFLSPEMLPILDRLGVDLQSQQPAPIDRLRLRFPSFEKCARLPERAYGLSRYRFDQMLVDRAEVAGAEIVRRDAQPGGDPFVAAVGRKHAAVKGSRLFGFKAHFEGPANDTIELHFLRDGYVGINAVEGGVTNVCGLASEATLRRIAFDYDEYVDGSAPLRERLRPLRRSMVWMSAGPLVFGTRFRQAWSDGVYPAGDALSFVDPFTGTGLASAVITGDLAGSAAARRERVSEHVGRCRNSLTSPFLVATLCRFALRSRALDVLASLVPSEWLVRWTRPRRNL